MLARDFSPKYSSPAPLGRMDYMADNPTSEFGIHPLEWIRKPNKAAKLLVRYLNSTESGFDRLGHLSDPDQITPVDLVRVGMLGDPVPADSAMWLLSEEGKWLTAEVLSDIPVHLELRTPHPTAAFRCADLLGLLRSTTSKWPPGDGPALKRKQSIQLLAAKRPGLVPLDDRILRIALDAPKDDNWWRRWRSVMTEETIEAAAAIRSRAAESEPFAAELPILRVMDIVVRSRSTS